MLAAFLAARPRCWIASASYASTINQRVIPIRVSQRLYSSTPSEKGKEKATEAENLEKEGAGPSSSNTTSNQVPKESVSESLDIEPANSRSTPPAVAPQSATLASTSTSTSDIQSPEGSEKIVSESLESRGIPDHVLKTYPQKGAHRPHLGVEVNPKHGLWHFFRLVKINEQREFRTTLGGQMVSPEQEGTWGRVAVEDRHPVYSPSGRAWQTGELHRKSFADLHTLWYIVLREKNLLATQEHELARSGLNVSRGMLRMVKLRMMMCRKTHARIKCVLSERRRGYERAIDSLPDGLAAWRKERWGGEDSPTFVEVPEEEEGQFWEGREPAGPALGAPERPERSNTLGGPAKPSKDGPRQIPSPKSRWAQL